MPMRSMTAAALLVVASGCAHIDDFVNRPAPVVAHLEVFNRTEADLFYVAADGERLDVPACGSASAATFRIESVTVRTEEGYIRGFGAGGPEHDGRHVTLLEVARAVDSTIPSLEPPPDPLPPCAGLPEVQVGI
jgi:hypothetical protein